ncbi:succinate dehydrogenase [Stutzerimonas azotifigens]|uniref:succinate dehydrogenase n=1 Tax=Stutzerimonas azotifigens TaxID=291995 RepID=UPI0004859503|nr:succinate dehydrogenase [Stutzerimonas azotifigens]
MTPRTAARLWALQRLSAAYLAIAVLVHLATIIYAIHGGLSSAEILGRTQGNLAWLLFYASFVVAVALHMPIGLRNVLSEHLGWRGRSLDLAMLAVALVVLGLGAQAVLGVFL